MHTLCIPHVVNTKEQSNAQSSLFEYDVEVNNFSMDPITTEPEKVENLSASEPDKMMFLRYAH
jgi:hypothetical protein